MVSVAESLKRGEPVSLDWHDDDLSLGLYRVWSANRWVSPALEAFIENMMKADLFEAAQ